MTELAPFETPAQLREHYKAVRKRLFTARPLPVQPRTEANLRTFMPRFVSGKRVRGGRDFWFLASQDFITKPTAKTIIADILDRYTITLEALRGPSRRTVCVLARAQAAYRLRRDLSLSLHQVGKHINRDHSSVVNLLKRFDENGQMIDKNYTGAFKEVEVKTILYLISTGAKLHAIYQALPYRARSSIAWKVKKLSAQLETRGAA